MPADSSGTAHSTPESPRYALTSARTYQRRFRVSQVDPTIRIRNQQQHGLAGLDLFRGCTTYEIVTILRLSAAVALPAGTTVWRGDRTATGVLPVVRVTVSE